MQTEEIQEQKLVKSDFKQEVIKDYKIAVTSRECSLLGRREVLTGKAKFGIFGDGKEIPQLAWARAFENGDFRSGYYRDQTFMMAIGELTIEQFFAGLYANTDIKEEPMSAGRQMGGHFATHSLNEDGSWKRLIDQKNSSADISPTAGQMPRLLGLAQASKVYRHNDLIPEDNGFSNKGNEVAWGTIGNASTSEGHFWESFNAAGVLQVPMVISVWDDEYGISVHARHQTTKESISKIQAGFQRDHEDAGFEIMTVKGWDYVELVETYEKASKIAREEHVPVLIHVQELTQPQGHSTSGSHERYKNEERLEWERTYDCNVQFRKWLLDNEFATDDELSAIEKDIKKQVRDGKKAAWSAFINPIVQERDAVLPLLENVANQSADGVFIKPMIENLKSTKEPIRKEILETVRKTLRYTLKENSEAITALNQWLNGYSQEIQNKYSSHLYSESAQAATKIEAVVPEYNDDSEEVDARLIMRDNFDAIFASRPDTMIFGEDAGEIGDVNQGLEGMQEKYGELRVSDTGIREATILGQGIGLAMRGLRPIAEIQYLDYLLYCLQIMSDDLATVQYRTAGRQKAPLIIRTRGHRLEGIWHSGSPMGGIINSVRGIHVLVPRNMTQAAGFYNTMLESDEPALIVECLNGYRLKEKLPVNLGEFKTPIGQIEILKEGKDITVVSYGSTLRLIEEAAVELERAGIDIEIIDVQSLLPFDINQEIKDSVEKTNRLLVIDEDVPGGASAFILQKIVDQQNAWRYLDSKPQALAAKAHRPAYSTDGDYFSKPSVDDIFDKVYAIMNEAQPAKYPKNY
ncbi:alpha-ketoacid dehydrogenase subunit alpha/beta [Nonlabens ulvanivorans]|uniref:3-methyl-2-oxobutanoate dehydrogenase (2-methylpropanoyl-transferring) n=1 Tax=Nonlabens ulvanivorans TaxID=906888 RepID=A0A084JVM7_NONUL|nr:alpha-ketoacid dehydrogenase subunit alpha/beta [Nonlabens ulvanivorans]KEZ93011.1 transketolase [Nonlabens ulvanivorans]PRX12759.1 pyruvate/2-oxoglutarate/acetoin dehydrogenase E1 component [Nonlabens ulvanivorans]